MHSITRKQVIVACALLVALLQLLGSRNYHGPGRWFVTGYLFDLLIPLMFYLLLSLAAPQVSNWTRGLAVFAAGALVEFLQFFGVPIFGQTFDPFDLLVYALGVLAGMAVESKLLSRLRTG